MAVAKSLSSRAIRKRDAYTRARAKRTRPRTPAPKEGWVLADVARLTGISVRALRYYISAGLLRPLEFRGTATRYPRRELLRLLKMLQLRGESRQRVVLSEVKRQLDALGDAGLEAWASKQRLSPELAAALGVETKAAPPARSSGAGSAGTGSAGAGSAGLEGAGVETWRRIQLLPGLELMLSVDASPVVQSLAQRLYAEYAGSRVS